MESKETIENTIKYVESLMEFNSDTAKVGDMYFYDGSKLLYYGNAMLNQKKPCLFKRIIRKLFK